MKNERVYDAISRIVGRNTEIDAKMETRDGKEVPKDRRVKIMIVICKYVGVNSEVYSAARLNIFTR